MNSTLGRFRDQLANWIRPKSMPSSLTGGQWSGTSYVDAYKRNREPTPNELLAELKSTAFACISINASVCASFEPRLYVTTHEGQPEARCLTKALDRKTEHRLRHLKNLPARITKARSIEQVLDHPLLTLLGNVNPAHNAFDLWELTTTYQEVHGSAYWLLDIGPLGVPEQIWILPSQNVTPKRNPNSANLVDYYEYTTGHNQQRFSPGQIIHFRYPDPRNPYTAGLAPLRACFEQASMLSEYAAFKKARFENRAIPDAIVSPDETVGEEERDRFEAQWNSKLRRGGNGRVVVAETGLKVQLLQQSMGDLAALAEMGKTKEDICNAFHIPVAYFTSQTNLANLQASERLHMTKAIEPRLTRRDEKLNQQLIPLYDPSGRLFLASEDPVPVDADQSIAQETLDLKYGVVTINELRGERGLPAVDYGDQPWLPLMWAQTDIPERLQYAPHNGMPRVGRRKPPQNAKGVVERYLEAKDFESLEALQDALDNLPDLSKL
jgi:HK97 family phage portal protein